MAALESTNMDIRLFSARLLPVCVLLCLCSISANAAHVIEEEKSVPELMQGLEQGGYLVYMRHAATDHTQKDTNRENLAECSTQRNLSAEGREDARQIFATVKQRGIQFSVVYSSPYCRARDTAKLMADQVIIDENLQFSISKDSAEAKKLGKYLYQKMLFNDPGDSNVLIVGHTSNLRDGLGIWPKPEGVMVIFSIRGDHLVYHGIISPDDWAR